MLIDAAYQRFRSTTGNVRDDSGGSWARAARISGSPSTSLTYVVDDERPPGCPLFGLDVHGMLRTRAGLRGAYIFGAYASPAGSTSIGNRVAVTAKFRSAPVIGTARHR